MGSFFVYQHYSVTTILQVVIPISFLKKVIFGSPLQYRFSKIIPSFFVDKASCTRQFENELSLHSLASLFPIKEGIFRKPTRPSLPLRKAFFYLSVSPARKDFFRKPTRPSLPLRKAPPLISVFSPQARRRKPPYSAVFAPPVPPQREGPYPIPKP